MPSIALKLSDFRIPAIVAGALLTGFTAGGGMNGDLNSASAIPGQFLSAPADGGLGGTPQAVTTSLRPKARPAVSPGWERWEQRIGEVPCLEQAVRLNGQMITYVSNNCLWYENIDREIFPQECIERIAGIDGGRPVFEVGCLIRVGFWQSPKRHAWTR